MALLPSGVGCSAFTLTPPSVRVISLFCRPQSKASLSAFNDVPEMKAGKNRVHLDLVVDDLDEATAEVEKLGGRWLEPENLKAFAGVA